MTFLLKAFIIPTICELDEGFTTTLLSRLVKITQNLLIVMRFSLVSNIFGVTGTPLKALHCERQDLSVFSSLHVFM